MNNVPEKHIYGHSTNIIWQKIKARSVFQIENQGNFLLRNKKIVKKNVILFFNIIRPTQAKK